jgi:lipoate-protein ligase A
MRLIDRCPPDPIGNIALDSVLFAAVEERDGEETLWLWESPQPAVVVGRFGVIGREINERACRADGVPVMRRITGGGAVVIGPGCLNYACVLSLEARPELRDVAGSYGAILGWIVEALGAPGLDVAGVSDLAVGDRKVGGSAQRRGRRALLHHGTVLYGFDASLMERYLKTPRRQPAYRAGRRHAAFVTNAPMEPVAIVAGLARAFVLHSGSLPRRT